MTRAMKDSGIPWVGKIPADWEVKRISWLMSRKPPQYSPEEELLSVFLNRGVIRFCEEEGKRTNVTSLDLSKYQLVEPGDFVLNNQQAWRGSVGVSNYRGIISPAYIILRLAECLGKSYANHLLRSKCIVSVYEQCSRGVGSIQRNLIWDWLRFHYLPVPPLAEQKRIAAYLDEVTGSIDGLREKIAREIERLDDYKKSVITEAVCHGLDKSAKMKDSGIPWVGKVPSAWEVTRGKYFLKLLSRPTKEDDGVITCFRDGEVTLRSKRREDGFTISLKECGYQGVEPGDLVVHGMDGFAGSIGISDSRGKASPVLNVMDSSQCKRYIMYYLRSMAYGDVFTGLATGIRVRSCDLRWNKLANLQYILPPLPEQKRIAAHLDEVTVKVDEVIAKRKAEMERLEAAKRSIICECVTGKRVVSG